jgi:hypothetical protein
LYYEIEGVLQDTKDGAPMDKVCRETLLRVQSRLDSALSATQRSEPDAAALRYLLDSTAPDGQWADQAVHNFVGAMLKQSPPPATARSEPTEWQVEVAAGEIAASPLIDAPKLPFPAWMGLARSILNAVFAAAPLSEKQAGGTAKVPESYKEFAQRAAKNIINSADAQCFRWLLKHHSGSGKAMGGVGMRCWIGGVEFQGDDVATAILEAIDREKPTPSPDGNNGSAT